MLDIALAFIAGQVNAGCFPGTVEGGPGPLVVGPLQDAPGPAVGEDLTLTLCQIEQEVSRHPVSPSGAVFGPTAQPAAPLHLALTLILSARDDHYDTALRQLSQVMRWLHTRPLFTSANSPLPAGIEHIGIECMNASLEQTGQIWASLGARYRPSVLYRLRLLASGAEPAGPGRAPRPAVMATLAPP